MSRVGGEQAHAVDRVGAIESRDDRERRLAQVVELARVVEGARLGGARVVELAHVAAHEGQEAARGQRSVDEVAVALKDAQIARAHQHQYEEEEERPHDLDHDAQLEALAHHVVLPQQQVQLPAQVDELAHVLV